MTLFDRFSVRLILWRIYEISASLYFTARNQRPPPFALDHGTRFHSNSYNIKALFQDYAVLDHSHDTNPRTQRSTHNPCDIGPGFRMLSSTVNNMNSIVTSCNKLGLL